MSRPTFSFERFSDAADLHKGGKALRVDFCVIRRKYEIGARPTDGPGPRDTNQSNP